MSGRIASQEKIKVVDPQWKFSSQSRVRQDQVGACAEKNGNTPNCRPGRFELCEHCSFYPRKKRNN